MTKKRLLFVLALALVAALTAVRAGETDPALVRKVENGLLPDLQIGPVPPQSLEARMKACQAPGVSIAVLRDSQVEWAKGYGLRDVRSGAPVTPETLFQAASITKCMGAVVALRLVQDGVLDLDRNVNDYLKRWQVPDNEFTKVEKVTLRRLLNHTAGLNVHGFRGYAEGEPVPTIIQVLEGVPPANNQPIRVVRVPGTSMQYSGGGYTILQLLLEDVTGRSLPDMVAQYVFQPAGMTCSSFCLASAGTLAENASLGHNDKGEEFKGYSFLPGGSTCCELWTTPTDLCRFVLAVQKALRGEPGAILSREMARAMTTPDAGRPCGLGFFIVKHGDEIYFNHDGGNVGFNSRFIGSLDQGFGFAVMANSDNASGLIEEVSLAVTGACGRSWEKPICYPDAAALLADCRQKRKANPDDPRYGENSLNRLGYKLLTMGYPETAGGVFRLNVEFCPRSANACDSLAEFCERQGDRASAVKYYRQALELLDKYPEPNKGYASNRAATIEKIRKLEGETGK